MTDKNLTDNEIKKALEEWIKNYNGLYGKFKILGNALDLINRLQADCENYKQVAENQQKVTMDRGFEIKELKAELDEYAKTKTTIDEFWKILLTLSLCKRKEKPTLEEFAEAIQEIKSEAYKEFAERLKEKIIAEYNEYDEQEYPRARIEDIDNLLKELVGDSQ